MLRAEGLGFAFPGGPPVLENLELAVAPGEWVALLGENGSGKSTLARLLAGLLRATAGRVTVDGLDPGDPSLREEARQRVGIVFQNPDNQIVASRVDEDVAFGPANLGLPPAELKRRVAEALGFVGLSAKRDRPPHELSGGEKQRLAVAGVLALETRYLVLDEPTSMLDPLGREQLLALLDRLRRERGTGILYITHFAEEARLADRAAVLASGRIAGEGSPRQVFGLAEALGLEVPPMFELAGILAGEGFHLPGPPLTVEEMADILARLWKAGERRA